MQVNDATSPLIVGIGGSAGALPALMVLLEALGGEVPVALVVVLHLSPDHESSAAEILQRHTPLIVTQVTQRTLLQAGHVYVIAPGTNLITDDGHVQPAAASTQRPSTVIDHFFRTLAEVHREQAIAVMLSGTGHDGASGITQINEFGGLTIAQAPDDCQHDDMPLAAIATGAVDLVLSAEAIGKRLIYLAGFPRLPKPATDAASEAEPAAGPVATAIAAEDDASPERALRDVLTALRVRMRHDFRHYKRATVMRRLERRVQVNGLASVQAYRDFVQEHPEELTPLLADMLISVTNFFRDAEAFEALQREVVPRLMQGRSPNDEVRAWVPACASGEESYSVAILLHEHANTMQQPPRLQLFASDINDAALAQGRAAVYPASVAADITESRLLAYFERDDSSRYRVRTAVRETVVFAHHNVLGDPPFSRMDLICCRNLLIYLDRTAQAAVLDMFAYALKPGGYLFLGNAESIDLAGADFEAVSKAHRIYRLKTDAASKLRVRLPRQLISATSAVAHHPAFTRAYRFEPIQERGILALHERALVAAAPPNVLINADYDLERVSPGAGRFVTFGEGAPTRNLLGNVAADIRTELRAALYRANDSQRPVKAVFRRDAGASDTGDARGVMTLTVCPVEGASGERTHWLVMFEESDPVGGLAVRLAGEDSSAREAGFSRLEEENRALKVDLQDTLDRSAISTEELKASNEELQAINEELRSAKEELEASKEELQSLNEELTTVNFELRMKVEESGRSNDDLRNLMDVTEIATVFVDAGMRVTRFTPQATKLFPLIPSDVGRPLTDVKGQLQYDEMLDDALAAFQQLRSVERTVKGLDGAQFLARVLPYRTSQDKIGGVVLTFTNVTKLRDAENAVGLAEERIRDAIAASRDFAVITTDVSGTITAWNEGATAIFGHAPEAVIGGPFDVIFTPEDRAAGAPAAELQDALRLGRAADERWHLHSDGSTVYCSGVVTQLRGRGHAGFIKICNDQTKSKRIELRQGIALGDERRRSASASDGNTLRDRFLAVMSHELKQPLNLIQVNAELLIRLPEFAQSPVVQRIGGTIMRAVGAQETIVNDLLDLSRVQTGKMHLEAETADLAEIVQMLAQAIGDDAQRKGVVMEVDAAPGVMCHADPVRLEQVVWNLLGNALKFTPTGGRVDVKVAVDGDFARLDVADTGIGISADYLPRIFELFGQAPASESAGAHRAGLGIGLALVRELVIAHGGRIEAASAGTGQGAAFTVWLPSAAVPAPAGQAASMRSSVAKRRVLLVDDEPDSLEAFAMLLTLQGADVDTASSGAAALEKLAGGDYDLLLSDIGMPEMSGIELIGKARQLELAKPFRSIAITGYGSNSDVRDALDAGFDAHVSKPISIERLEAALQKL